MEGKVATGDKCPWLGLLKDPATYFSYPTPVNLCFKVYPAGSVDLKHQGKVCLTGGYSACPIYYKLTPLDALPEGLRGEHSDKTADRKALRWAPAFLAIAVSIFALWFALGRFFRSGFSPDPQPTTSLAAVESIAPAYTPTMTASPLPEPSSPALRGPDIMLLPIIQAQPALEATPTQAASVSITGPTVTPESSLLPTATETIAVTPTHTSAPSTEQPTASPGPCTPPNGWVSYTIRPGDTLSKIASSFQTTVAELIRANCLSSASTIYAGQRIYVPYVPPTGVPTKTPTPKPTSTPLPTATSTLSPADTPTFSPTLTETPTDTPVPATPTSAPTEAPTEQPETSS